MRNLTNYTFAYGTSEELINKSIRTNPLSTSSRKIECLVKEESGILSLPMFVGVYQEDTSTRFKGGKDHIIQFFNSFLGGVLNSGLPFGENASINPTLINVGYEDFLPLEFVRSQFYNGHSRNDIFCQPRLCFSRLDNLPKFEEKDTSVIIEELSQLKDVFNTSKSIDQQFPDLKNLYNILKTQLERYGLTCGEFVMYSVLDVGMKGVGLI